MSCGVGQGSGLGGHLFLALINTILSLFIFCKVLLFVDDVQSFLHVSVNEINDAIQKSNADSAALHHWLVTHGLQLNAAKTQAVIIGSRHNLRLLNQIKIAIFWTVFLFCYILCYFMIFLAIYGKNHSKKKNIAK